MDSAWRLHISNSAIANLDWVAGKPALLSVWLRDNRVGFYAQETGIHHTDLQFTLPAADAPADVWSAFAASLKAPNLTVLPHAIISGAQLWTVDDGGALMVYRGGASLSLIRPEQVTQNLTFDVTPLALVFDAASLTAVAIDRLGSVMIGTVTGSIRTVKPGFNPDADLPVRMAAAPGLTRIAISDGTHLAILDSRGKIVAEQDLAYICGELALFPDSKHLLTYDGDSRVIRAYSTEDLTLVGQKFTSDLLGGARKTQLIADPPPKHAAVNALACGPDGVFAFAVMGHVCSATLEHLRPKPVQIHAPRPATKPMPSESASKTAKTPVVKSAVTEDKPKPVASAAAPKPKLPPKL
jgi:hypothetical protein